MKSLVVLLLILSVLGYNSSYYEISGDASVGGRASDSYSGLVSIEEKDGINLTTIAGVIKMHEGFPKVFLIRGKVNYIDDSNSTNKIINVSCMNRYLMKF